MSYFDFSLNAQQADAFAQFQQFAGADHPPGVFLLRGYAGTGKTTLVKGLLSFLVEQHALVELLATTGRAAKVLGERTGRKARTVHSLVYKFGGLNHDILAAEAKGQQMQKAHTGEQLLLDFIPRQYVPPQDAQEQKRPRFYLVDESSMIADQKGNLDSYARYGEGRILRDLLAYDPAGKYVFIGDPCQLPPVGDSRSPALDASYLRSEHGKIAKEVELTQVMRQRGEQHQVLAAATHLRQLILAPSPPPRPAKLPVQAYVGSQVVLHRDLNALYQHFLSVLRERGDTYMTLICHTNQQRQGLNQIIRKELGKPGPALEVGDLLMATQNTLLAPIVNGDLLRVREMGSWEVRGGQSFRQVKVSLIHKPEEVYELFLIEKLLGASVNNLDEAEHRQLMIDFAYRMKDRNIKQGSERFEKMMREDPYLNALRAVYGYAVTGHKAQGGEWPEVFIWQEEKIAWWPGRSTYRWWYTALTRAVERVHLSDANFIC